MLVKRLLQGTEDGTVGVKTAVELDTVAMAHGCFNICFLGVMAVRHEKLAIAFGVGNLLRRNDLLK